MAHSVNVPEHSGKAHKTFGQKVLYVSLSPALHIVCISLTTQQLLISYTLVYTLGWLERFVASAYYQN